jgi:hypothetical protein
MVAMATATGTAAGAAGGTARSAGRFIFHWGAAWIYGIMRTCSCGRMHHALLSQRLWQPPLAQPGTRVGASLRLHADAAAAPCAAVCAPHCLPPHCMAAPQGRAKPSSSSRPPSSSKPPPSGGAAAGSWLERKLSRRRRGRAGPTSWRDVDEGELREEAVTLIDNLKRSTMAEDVLASIFKTTALAAQELLDPLGMGAVDPATLSLVRGVGGDWG